MLARLRLRAGLVASHEEQGRVHDSRACEHGRHEDVVARAIDERDVSDQEELRLTPGRGALGAVFLVRAEGLEALRGLARRALVELGVRVTKLDGNVPKALLVVAHRLREIRGRAGLR